MSGCTCEDFEYLKQNSDMFQPDSEYGWILQWIELTQEDGYQQVHRYGLAVAYCPFCGEKLT